MPPFLTFFSQNKYFLYSKEWKEEKRLRLKRAKKEKKERKKKGIKDGKKEKPKVEVVESSESSESESEEGGEFKDHFGLLKPYSQTYFKKEQPLVSKKEWEGMVREFTEVNRKKMEADLLQMHRCRFVQWNPTAVNALSFNTSFTLLAVGRADSSIELRSADAKTVYKKIPGVSDKTGRVQALCWLKDERGGEHLVSAGLHGLISVWDLSSMRERQTEASMGGSVWCMRANSKKNQISVGCEDGTVRIFDFSEGELSYKSSIPSSSFSGEHHFSKFFFFWV